RASDKRVSETEMEVNPMSTVSKMKSNCKRTFLPALLCFLSLTLFNGTAFPAGGPIARLDREIKSAFAALRVKKWKQAQTHFERAVELFEASPTTSRFVLANLPQSTPASVAQMSNSPNQDGLDEQLKNYYHVMGTR